MASRYFSVSANGLVHVKHRGAVGRVVKANQSGSPLWDCYVGSRKVGQSRGKRNGARLILKHLGITEKSVMGAAPRSPGRRR